MSETKTKNALMFSDMENFNLKDFFFLFLSSQSIAFLGRIKISSGKGL